MINELKAYQKEKGMTQEQLAVKLGVSFTTINRWFKGKNKPSKMAEAKLREFLGRA